MPEIKSHYYKKKTKQKTKQNKTKKRRNLEFKKLKKITRVVVLITVVLLCLASLVIKMNFNVTQAFRILLLLLYKQKV